MVFANRIEPNRVGEGFKRPLHPGDASFFVPMLDAAAGISGLRGAHTRVPDEDNPIVRSVRVQQIPDAEGFLITPLVVSPNPFVQEVVKIVVLEVLEFGARRRE